MVAEGSPIADDVLERVRAVDAEQVAREAGVRAQQKGWRRAQRVAIDQLERAREDGAIEKCRRGRGELGAVVTRGGAAVELESDVCTSRVEGPAINSAQYWSARINSVQWLRAHRAFGPSADK